MARTTKTDLEQRLTEKEEELNKYRQWLMESEEKYNKLVDEKTEQFKLLPEYLQMKNRIERLESMQQNSEYIIKKKKEKEENLRNKIQALLEENNQLKESIKNKTVINDTKHNARGAGRKHKSAEKIQEQLQDLNRLLNDGKKELEICESMKISHATYYRLKKLWKLQYH